MLMLERCRSPRSGFAQVRQPVQRWNNTKRRHHMMANKKTANAVRNSLSKSMVSRKDARNMRRLDLRKIMPPKAGAGANSCAAPDRLPVN